ncbi:MAG: TatD family hydrolase [Rickettsiales bacterium]|jgi:TatD DNase family protein|nr:TatD family hydrolase [Rickettsiales bacterium]
MNDFLVDSHCHLDMVKKDIESELDNIIDVAYKNGVKIINNIGTSIDEFDDIIESAIKYNNVFASIGVHPSEIKDKIISIDVLEQYFKRDKVIGVGESGLDYHYPDFDKNKQKKNFETHIELARRENKPLIIHSRDADEDMLEILESEIKNGEFKFLLHSFSSGEKLCWTGLDLGGYISISGIITFKNAENLREIVKSIPTNRMLLETDSPFLSPVPYRGKINQPAYVKYIAEYISSFLSKPFDEIQRQTTENFLKLFNLENVF